MIVTVAVVLGRLVDASTAATVALQGVIVVVLIVVAAALAGPALGRVRYPGSQGVTVSKRRDSYVFAGRNMTGFVTSWLASLTTDNAAQRWLLTDAQTASMPSDRYGAGAAFVMVNIAPRAARQTASDDELLLYAIMAVYQDADYPGAEPTHWDGCRAHCRRAFHHAVSLGEREVARRLRAAVMRRSHAPRSQLYTRLLGNDPARIAAHEQEIAAIDQRNIRAAALIDPNGSFDHQRMRP